MALGIGRERSRPANHQRLPANLHLRGEACGYVTFESLHVYTKREADYRAMALSSQFGLDCDELPTHPVVEATPKLEP